MKVGVKETTIAYPQDWQNAHTTITQTALKRINLLFPEKNVFEHAILPVTEHVPDKWQDFSLQLFLTDCRIKCAVFKDKLSLLNRTYSQSLFQSYHIHLTYKCHKSPLSHPS